MSDAQVERLGCDAGRVPRHSGRRWIADGNLNIKLVGLAGQWSCSRVGAVTARAGDVAPAPLRLRAVPSLG
eukprot:3396063-Alexandrium_andersonii.AAC.1